MSVSTLPDGRERLFSGLDLSPESISHLLNGGRTADVVAAEIQDVSSREELARDLMGVPEVQSHFESINDLQSHLAEVAETLRVKEGFVGRSMESKAAETIVKKKPFWRRHPVLVASITAALAAWGLSGLLGYMRDGNLELADATHDTMDGVNEAAKDLSPTPGITSEGDAGSGGTGAAPNASSPYDAPMYNDPTPSTPDGVAT